MLIHKSLLFPTLVRLPGKTASLQTRSERSKLARTELPLYRMDWRAVDDAKFSAHIESIHDTKADGAGTEKNFYRLTTPEWQHRLDSMEFAVSDEYASEIARVMYSAQAEWVRNLPFHRSVRFDCLKTARAAVDVAFGLLADCHWGVSDCDDGFLELPQSRDEAENFRNFTRDSSWVRGGRFVYHTAMLVRFWDQQCPSVFVADWSGIKKYEGYTNTPLIIDLLKSFKQQYELRSPPMFEASPNEFLARDLSALSLVESVLWTVRESLEACGESEDFIKKVFDNASSRMQSKDWERGLLDRDKKVPLASRF